MYQVLMVFPFLCVIGYTSAQETYSAKSLFFGEDDAVLAVSSAPKDKKKESVSESVATKTKTSATTNVKNKPANSNRVGASYFIRMKNPDGSTRDVLASQVFKSGDRIQLGIKVNKPSYIYVMNEGSDGKVTQLYPQTGQNNFIDAMGFVFLPSKGSFAFDSVPGVEQILVYMSQTPIQNNLTETIKTATPDLISETKTMVANSNCTTPVQKVGKVAEYASKSIFFDAEECPVKCNDTSATYASKGMAFSEDAQPESGGQVASYVVKTLSDAKQNLYLKIKLHHK